MNERLKEIKESLNMNCSDMTWCVETITDLIETIEQQQEEIERYKKTLKDFAENGTRHDANPTLIMDGGNEVSRLLDYIRSMDNYVRAVAKSDLKGSHHA